MEILSVIESRFTSGVVQAKVLIFKIILLFPSFKCFSEPSRDLCLQIARVDFKEGLRGQKQKLRKVCQQLNLLKIIMSVLQCMNILLQLLCLLRFSFPVNSCESEFELHICM